MAQSRIALLLAIFSGLVAVALAASAASPSDQANGNENSELLYGYYSCGFAFDPPQAFAWVDFRTSGDILPDSYFYPYREYGDASSPETCEAAATASVAILAGSGCSLGPVTVSEDDTGVGRSFQFVCRARRGGIVAVIEEVLAELISGSP